MTEPAIIAARLTRGQRSTLAQLDRTFCILGCAEKTAQRLCKGGTRRPPLVITRPGEKWPEFALNDLGMAVKGAL